MSYIQDVLDVLSMQSSEALTTGAMRVAAAMHQLEFETLIHPQNDRIFSGIGNVTCLVCDQGTNKTKPSH